MKLLIAMTLIVVSLTQTVYAAASDYKYKAGDIGPNDGFIVYSSHWSGTAVEAEEFDVYLDYPYETSTFGKLSTWLSAMVVDWTIDDIHTWRLPTVEELKGLKKLEDGGETTNIQPTWYWTNNNRQNENGLWEADAFSFLSDEDLDGRSRVGNYPVFGNRAMRTRLVRDIFWESKDVCKDIDAIDSDEDKFTYVVDNLNHMDQIILQNSECPLIFKVGDKGLGGGYVYYVKDGGIHGLEAAPGEFRGTWGCRGKELGEKANIRMIGGGRENTKEMIEAGCTGENTIATLTTKYESNGYTDWFIPSIDSLIRMSSTISGMATEGTTKQISYWSSTKDKHQRYSRAFRVGRSSDFGFQRDIYLNEKPVREF